MLDFNYPRTTARRNEQNAKAQEWHKERTVMQQERIKEQAICRPHSAGNVRNEEKAREKLREKRQRARVSEAGRIKKKMRNFIRVARNYFEAHI